MQVDAAEMARKPRRGVGRPPALGGNAGRSQVQSLGRAIDLLRRIAEQRGGLGLNDLARRAGLPPSTAHRLLMTLRQHGMVHDNGLGRWQVGVEAFIVGSAFVRDRNLVEIARPIMQQLMQDAGETVNLAIGNDGEAVYVAQVECEQIMRVFSRPGVRVPLHSSGVGKALLAATAAEKVAGIVQRRGLPRLTGRTIGTPDRLQAELAEVRRRGYAVDDEEHAVGVRCVAAPVFDEAGGPLAAVSISGPVARISDDRLPRLGARVAQAAAAITEALGGRANGFGVTGG